MRESEVIKFRRTNTYWCGNSPLLSVRAHDEREIFGRGSCIILRAVWNTADE
jgi:hypothetical protein